MALSFTKRACPRALVPRYRREHPTQVLAFRVTASFFQLSDSKDSVFPAGRDGQAKALPAAYHVLVERRLSCLSSSLRLRCCGPKTPSYFFSFHSVMSRGSEAVKPRLRFALASSQNPVLFFLAIAQPSPCPLGWCLGLSRCRPLGRPVRSCAASCR